MNRHTHSRSHTRKGIEKSRIRETKHLSTDADSSTDTTVGQTKNTQKPELKTKQKKTEKIIQNAKTQKVQKYAKISDTPFDQRSLIHRDAWFPPCFVRQNQPKKTIFFVWRFQITSKKKCSNLRPLLSTTFPQGFQISKNIGHSTSGSGGKETFKRYLKSEHIHRQTNKQTNIWTFRLIESIGPEGRCFENTVLNN